MSVNEAVGVLTRRESDKYSLLYALDALLQAPAHAIAREQLIILAKLLPHIDINFHAGLIDLFDRSMRSCSCA